MGSGTIQMDDAARRNKEWNGKPCKHPSKLKEYFHGTATGDYVCPICGMALPKKDWDEMEKKHLR